MLKLNWNFIEIVVNYQPFCSRMQKKKKKTCSMLECLFQVFQLFPVSSAYFKNFLNFGPELRRKKKTTYTHKKNKCTQCSSVCSKCSKCSNFFLFLLYIIKTFSTLWCKCIFLISFSCIIHHPSTGLSPYFFTFWKFLPKCKNMHHRAPKISFFPMNRPLWIDLHISIFTKLLCFCWNP